jgi:ABC-type multidrug transport system fused ATPase/permease subunit
MIEITSLEISDLNIDTEPSQPQSLDQFVPIAKEIPVEPINARRMIADFSKILFAPENRCKIFLATLLTGCNISTHFLSPYLIGKITKSFSNPDDSGSRTWLITALMASQVFSKVFSTCIDHISTALEANITQKLLQKATTHFLNKSLDYHVQTPLSEMYSLLNKCFNVQNFGISFITRTVPMIVEIGCASVILYSQFDPIISISLLILTTSYVLYGAITTPYLFESRENFYKQAQDTFVSIGNILSRYKTIHDCNQQKKCIQELTESTEKLSSCFEEAFSKPSKYSFGSSLLSYSHTLFVLLYIARGIQSGRYTVENFTSVFGYLESFSSLLQGIGSSFEQIFSAYPDLKFLFNELSQPDEIIDPYPNVPLSILDTPSIEFNHVSFCYPTKNEFLFENLSFAIPAGKKVAIVSRSGAGKTSLFNLLYRYYSPSKGSIKIAGQDIHQVSLQSLQKQICLLGQNPNLFQGTMRENILFGAQEDIPDEIILTLAKSVGFQDLFDTLSLDTEVGEGGKSLSGGQQQKVALLRSLMKKSPILLLDEATASIDVVSANQMLQTLLTTEKVTTLMITHKLQEARLADEILLIGEGKLLGRGTHDELIENCSPYQELWSAQHHHA